MKRRKALYDRLILEHFTPLEARELSVLPKSTPALNKMRRDRLERRARFEKEAAWRIASGKWKREDIPRKWLANLTRWYTKERLRVQFGPEGKQPKMVRGMPNPWAAYRQAEKDVGGPGTKGYVSPWEVKQLREGRTFLEKGLIFVQRAERKKVSKNSGVSQVQVREWIAQKDEAISKARGKRKEQLIIERNRLERML